MQNVVWATVLLHLKKILSASEAKYTLVHAGLPCLFMHNFQVPIENIKKTVLSSPQVKEF